MLIQYIIILLVYTCMQHAQSTLNWKSLVLLNYWQILTQTNFEAINKMLRSFGSFIFNSFSFIPNLSSFTSSRFYPVHIYRDHLQETLSFLNCLNLILHSDLRLSSFLCGCNATQIEVVIGNPLMLNQSSLIIHTSLYLLP